MSRPARYLIASVPQVDGGVRELYARTSEDASAAQQLLVRDRAMLACITVDEYVDVDRDGTRTRYVLDGGGS